MRVEPETLNPSRVSVAWAKAEVPLLVACWLIARFLLAHQAIANAWLGASVWASAHGAGSLARSTEWVTGAASVAALTGAGLRIYSRRAFTHYEGLRQTGLFATCAPLCLLLPMAGAGLYLGETFLVTALSWWLGPQRREIRPQQAVWKNLVHESFPILSAACFLTLGWLYNQELLIRALLFAAGASMIMRAFLLENSPAES